MNQIIIKPSLVGKILGTIVILLALISFGMQYILFTSVNLEVYGQTVRRMFNVDEESNIPTMYSTCLLILACLLLFIISFYSKKEKNTQVLYWRILSIIFLYLSIDETCMLHESIFNLFHKLMGSSGIFYYAWVVPGVIITFTLGIFFMRFYLHLPYKTRFHFLVAVILLFMGFFGFEYLEGHYLELNLQNDLTYQLIVTIEETCKMAGEAVFNWALLVYISHNITELRIKISEKPTFDE